ncbi:MAG: Fur family transcriptional regulator [Candidatus Rokuibacteriota bacterium]
MDSEVIIGALKTRGYRMTHQRRVIVAEVLRTSGHITPRDVLRRVKRRLPEVSDSTVYRTIDLLESLGFIAHSHLGAGAEYHPVGSHDHVHLVCSRCGRSAEVPVSELEGVMRALAARSDFEPDLTHFAIAGLCGACRAS